ncbi:putative arabinosyltransferase ARAD1 [Drosera capensis]
MYGKPSFSVILLISLIFLSIILLSTTDLRSHLSPFLLLSIPTPSASPCRPLKVYMYDLPRRFNIAMMMPKKSEVDDDTPVTEKTLPMWPYRSGLRRQHSVEYWMMASLLWNGEGEGEGREVVRVSDPWNADVFFVPFFSSLSFNTHGHTMTDPETEVDRQLQVEVVNLLRQSEHWQRSQGRDHVIPMQHPNAFRFLRDELNASILVVVDFGRYPQSLSNLRKDVVAPYVHVVESYTDDDTSNPFESRTTLLFFRGRTVRKDEGKVRAILGKVLANYSDVRYESSFASDEGIRLSSEGMRSSKFCLHPAGDTPSSCRLFDAIVSHCVPVIVSDHIELPYEDEIDYSQFSIFFSFMEASKPGYMVEQLRQVPKDTWVKMWQRLKEVSHHFEFQYPPKKEDAVDMLWRQVRHKLPVVNLAVHRSRRLKVPDWWSQRR